MNFPDYPLIFYPVAFIAILLTGIAKGGFGAIAGGLAVPIMSLVILPQVAAGIMLPILCAMDIFSAQAYWKKWSAHHLRVILPSLLVGIAIGGLLFGILPTSMIRLIIGFISVTFAISKYFYLIEKIAEWMSLRARTPGKFFGMCCGLIAGITTTLAHAGGPALAVYIYSQKLDKTTIVATSAFIFFIGNFVKLIPYYFLGQLSLPNLSTSLLFAPLAPLGVWLGVWMHRRISEKIFFNISYALLFVSGAKLIYDAL